MEDAQRIERPRMVQAALEAHVEVPRLCRQVEDQLAVVDLLDLETPAGKALEEQFLFGPDAGAKNADSHVTRPSLPLPRAPAGARPGRARRPRAPRRSRCRARSRPFRRQPRA